MMTKKHFKEFATMIGRIESEKEREFVKDCVIGILGRDNPRFDFLRFEEWIRRVKDGESTKGLG